MYNAISMNTPSKQSEVKRCKDEYLHDVDFIMDEHFALLLPVRYQDVPSSFKMKLHCISKRIGYVFVDVFESMISLPRGRKVVAIKTQLEACLDSLASKNLVDYFDDDIAPHVYYVAGYLCHAGKKGAEKRTGDLGKCIGSLAVHFIDTNAEIELIRGDLPTDITSLVDKSAVHQCLTYPDLQFYSLVATIEYCYVELATPENLMIFGGGVLSTICNAMTEHTHFREHFASLFNDNITFEEATTQAALEFYVKVYSNLRLKDFCRKYNSQLSKTNTVGIRQSLAVNSKRNNNIKTRKRSPLPKDEVLDEEQLHLELQTIAERGLDDDSDIVPNEDNV